MRTDFGNFLVQKRLQRDISAKWIAEALGISQVYMCDIEKGRRHISESLLPRLAELLLLSEEDRCMMYDLAAKSKNTISADLLEYVMQNEVVRKALRMAQKSGVSDETWQEFVERISVQEDKK